MARIIDMEMNSKDQKVKEHFFIVKMLNSHYIDMIRTENKHEYKTRNVNEKSNIITFRKLHSKQHIKFHVDYISIRHTNKMYVIVPYPD